MIEKSSGSAVLQLGLRYDTEFIIYDDINPAAYYKANAFPPAFFRLGQGQRRGL